VAAVEGIGIGLRPGHDVRRADRDLVIAARAAVRAAVPAAAQRPDPVRLAAEQLDLLAQRASGPRWLRGRGEGRARIATGHRGGA
jgi:hypothetical protein